EPLAAAVCALVALAAPVGRREAFARHLAVLELDVADPDFRAVAAEHHAAARAALAGLLAAAVEDGTLLPAARPDRLARALHNAYQGALISWAVSGEGSLEAALRDDLEAVLEPWRA
ncbi:MAG: TetR/AcrR family transcriptional regulator, partial [Actinomycetota bacterium]|nr:TetR/AcrR family transcriptional regulator [Actinomycetota bacterium]